MFSRPREGLYIWMSFYVSLLSLLPISLTASLFSAAASISITPLARSLVFRLRSAPVLSSKSKIGGLIQSAQAIRYRAFFIPGSPHLEMATVYSLSSAFPRGSPETSGSSGKLSKTEGTCLRISNTMSLMASKEPPGLTKEVNKKQLEALEKADGSFDPFATLKHRFLRFKRHQFLENAAHFQNLAEVQEPKFLVIACADSRVCPSLILGFQAGEAFIVRNVANLIPSFETGPSETKAALEFAVNTLQVGNIMVIGHSRCGGIRALMSMQDETNSNGSFIGEWVVVGRTAKVRTKDAVADLSFDHQCSHCEKESVNNSIMNLLTYPWIEKRVRDGILSVHGGYYDFVDCTFQKWTLDYHGTMRNNRQISIKDRVFWG